LIYVSFKGQQCILAKQSQMDIQKNIRWLMKPYFILIFGVLLLIGLLLIYLFVFTSGFSKLNSDWGDVGEYLQGIAAVVNIFIFIAISILISQMDRNKNILELKFNQKKEMLSRFLNSYEKLLTKLYEFKLYLAENMNNVKEIPKDELLKYYGQIKILDTLSKSYFPDKELSFDFKTFMEKYNLLIGAVDEKKEEHNIKSNAKSLIKEIDSLIEKLTQAINSFLTKEIK
jgi:hypothetical protein